MRWLFLTHRGGIGQLSFCPVLDLFTPETLQFICPGANTGFLRGKRVIN